MIAPRHLDRAPIKEGLIDLKVILSEGTSVERLDALYQSFSSDYPKREPLITRGIQIRFEGEALTSVSNRKEAGYRYTSQDGKNVVQFRMDGFTFSRLEPYASWESMKAEAVKLWGIYCSAVAPSEITRVATRYINEIRLPLPFADFEQYLTAGPRVPSALPQGLGSFLTRVVLYDSELKADCIITQAFEGLADDVAPIVLDIDVSIRRSFDISSDEHWTVLDRLRYFKNRAFFESITERTAELFQ